MELSLQEASGEDFRQIVEIEKKEKDPRYGFAFGFAVQKPEKGDHLLVLKLGVEIIGFAYLKEHPFVQGSRESKTVSVELLGLRKKYRGKGHASFLVTGIESFASEKLGAEVLKGNPSGVTWGSEQSLARAKKARIRWFQSQGYVLDGISGNVLKRFQRKPV